MRNRWTTPLGAILVVVVAIVLIASAAFAVTVYAVPSGYAPGTPANNQTDTWEDLLDLPEGSCIKTTVDGNTYTLTSAYLAVIVKAGADPSAPAVNTIFTDPLAGQTVFADSNKTGLFDAGDKDISHIIFCGKVVTTTSPPPTTQPPTTASVPTTEPPATTEPPVTSPAETTTVSSPTPPKRAVPTLPATGSNGAAAAISGLALLAIGTAAILLSTRGGDH